MPWRVAVCERDGVRSWYECGDNPVWNDCPTADAWEVLLAVARRMPSGQILVDCRIARQGMHLVFDQALGLLVHDRPEGSWRPYFPHRPSPPAGASDWHGLHPAEFLASRGFPRAEAFGLLRLFLETGELPTTVLRSGDEHPLLPGIEAFALPDEWWQVEWVSAGEW